MLHNLQRKILELIALAKPLQDILDALCLRVEDIVPGSICSIMILNEETGALNVLAAPTGPSNLRDALDGLMPGKHAGSCGTAAHTRQAVIVSDTETDPRWEPLREVAGKLGIRACWSLPILSEDQALLGTVAISHPTVRSPTPAELALLETASSVAGIAIDRRRKESQLRKSEERYRDLYESAPLAYVSATPDGHITMVNARCVEWLGYSKEELLGRSVVDLSAPTPQGRDKARRLNLLARQGQDITGEELELERADGTRLWGRLSVQIIRDDQGQPIERRASLQDITEQKQMADTLHLIVEGVSSGTGQTFFARLVRHVGEALNVDFAFIGKLVDDGKQVQTLAAWAHGEPAQDFAYVLEGTPCQEVVEQSFCYYPEGIQARFPQDHFLADSGVEAYMGIALVNAEGRTIGLMDVMRTQPFANPHHAKSIIQMCAARVANELERLEWETALQERSQLAAFDAQISHVLTQSEGLADMLRGCTDTMVSHLGAAFARIWTLPEEGDVLELQASSGLYTHVDGPHSRVPVGQLKIGLIASERRPHLTNSVIGDPRVPEQEWAKREGMVAFAGYPLTIEGRVLGVMAMFARHPLTPFTLQMLESVSGRMALGIERKRSEEALRRQQIFLRQVIDINPNFIFAKDLEGRFTLVNQAVAAAYGTTVEELLGKTEADFHAHEEAVELGHQQDLEVIRSQGERFIPEEMILDAAGRQRWFQTVKRPLVNEHGVAHHVLAVATDITERKRAEESLRAIVEGTATATSTDFFRSLVCCLASALHADCVFIAECTDAEKTRVRTLAFLKDGQFVPNVEYPLDGTPCREVIDGAMAYYPEAVQAAFPQSRDLVKLQADGYVGVPLKDASGEVIGHLSLLNHSKVDFDQHMESLLKIFAGRAGAELERHRTEVALRDSEARVQAILDGSSSIIYVKDREGKYLLCNRQFENLFQVSREAVIGTTDKELFESEFAETFQRNDHKVLATGTPMTFEERAPHPDGPHTYISSKFPFVNQEGQPYAVCGISTDITDRKKREGLLQAIYQAESGFLATSDAATTFETLLANVLSLTDSEYGFIGEVLFTKGGDPYLHMHAISNIAWNDQTRELYERMAPNLEFFNMDTLFGQAIVTGEPVIANDPHHDPRRGGVPEGHPPLTAFLGLPFFHGQRVMGVVGLANRPGGYTHELVAFLQPFLVTCGTLINVHQKEQSRLETERALQASQLHLQQVLDERTRISRDLHDHILQSLFALGLLMSAAKGPFSEGRLDTGLEYMDQAIEQCNTAISEIRQFISVLPSTVGQEEDFDIALAKLVRAMELPTTTTFQVVVDSDAVRALHKDQALQLLNIAREALRNCLQHAHATRGKISLQMEGPFLRFDVKDDGVGLPAQALPFKGHGLKNMESRAKELDGTLTIQSEPGKGTQISVVIPKEGAAYDT